MGRNFQRRDDHSGRDRSSSPSLRNPGTEHPELPHGASQKESGRQLGVGGSQLTVMMLIATTKTRRPLGCGKSRAVESEENQKQAFLPSHRPWKSRKTRGIPTFPTAPTAAGISQTRSGILIVVDRKGCLTPDTRVRFTVRFTHNGASIPSGSLALALRFCPACALSRCHLPTTRGRYCSFRLSRLST